MMDAREFLTTILRPGIAWYSGLPGWNVPTDERAELLMLVISGTESGWTERIQSGPTPAAHSFFQMERGGMVTGVLSSAKTKELAGEVCRMMFVAPDAPHAWGVMATERGDKLAVAFARLGLWLDPHSLPALADEQGAFDCYVRVWRPGAVTKGGDRAVQARDRWHTVYQNAIKAVEGA